jgi:serine/threonine protein kinase/Flp pilus assembly protein TadD
MTAREAPTIPGEAADLLPPRPGDQPVRGHRLIRRRGRGGFAEVWEAEAPGGFRVAMKFVRLSSPLRAAELRALEVVRQIRHPNLLTSFGSWLVDDLLIVGMELADRSLWDRLLEANAQGMRGIPRDELLGYLAGAASGIDHLNGHRHEVDGRQGVGIQHRDLKPQNILLFGGGAKVGDFGLARIMDRSVATHTAAWTFSYAAPEFFGGHTSRHSDQYGLAVSYCQLRGGRLPYDGCPAAVMAGHLFGSPDLASLPGPERPVVARALSKRPEERWPDCLAFVEALRATAADAPEVLSLDDYGHPIPGPSSSDLPTDRLAGDRRPPVVSPSSGSWEAASTGSSWEVPADDVSATSTFGLAGFASLAPLGPDDEDEDDDGPAPPSAAAATDSTLVDLSTQGEESAPSATGAAPGGDAFGPSPHPEEGGSNSSLSPQESSGGGGFSPSLPPCGGGSGWGASEPPGTRPLAPASSTSHPDPPPQGGRKRDSSARNESSQGQGKTPSSSPPPWGRARAAGGGTFADDPGPIADPSGRRARIVVLAVAALTAAVLVLPLPAPHAPGPAPRRVALRPPLIDGPALTTVTAADPAPDREPIPFRVREAVATAKPFPDPRPIVGPPAEGPPAAVAMPDGPEAFAAIPATAAVADGTAPPLIGPELAGGPAQDATPAPVADGTGLDLVLPDEVDVPAGGRARLRVLVRRRGGAPGPVAVRFTGMPRDVSLECPTIPGDANAAEAVVTAAPGAVAAEARVLAVATRGPDRAEGGLRVKVGPDPAQAAFESGRRHLATGAYRRAIADFAEAIRLDPDDPRGHLWRAVAATLDGRLAEALADYTEAIRLRPDDALAFAARARAHHDLGNYAQALADYTEAIRLRPGDASALHRRGLVRYHAGDYAGAVADFTEVIRLDPRHAAAYRDRGDAFARLGRGDRGEADHRVADRLAGVPSRPVQATHDRPKPIPPGRR